jgi:hypothetical protein
MNTIGSHRALKANSIAALLASIEIYNKPKMEYRTECAAILLVNAWELLLKAILAKNKVRIFYPKKRNEEYRSLSLSDALKKSQSYFPDGVQYLPVSINIERLEVFRNNAIHYYNADGFDVLMYGLAQTSIVNFRDLMIHVFGCDIADSINISLLPLSFSAPPDPIEFLRSGEIKKSPAVAEYMRAISEKTKQLEDAGQDTGRFLTVFKVSLQSTKKIMSADLVVAVDNSNSGVQVVINRSLNPNDTHPYLRRKVISEVGEFLHGIKFTTHTFEAIAFFEKIKENPRFYWRPNEGGTSHYSPELVLHIKGLTRTRIDDALEQYRNTRKTKK